MGKGLCIKDPLFSSEMEAVSGPPLRGPPNAGRSHSAVVLSRTVGPNSVRAAPLASGLEGRCPLIDDDLAGEAPRCASLLSDRIRIQDVSILATDSIQLAFNVWLRLPGPFLRPFL